MEHYRHETAQAIQDDEEILSISVSTRKAVCPECGATYTAGGQTRVVKRKDLQKESENQYFKNTAFEENIGKFFGKKIDTAV
jgi:PHP family Zn ribbon phosphoesterase